MIGLTVNRPECRNVWGSQRGCKCSRQTGEVKGAEDFVSELQAVIAVVGLFVSGLQDRVSSSFELLWCHGLYDPRDSGPAHPNRICSCWDRLPTANLPRHGPPCRLYLG